VIITDRVGPRERESVLAIAMLLGEKRVNAEYAVWREWARKVGVGENGSDVKVEWAPT
jgi:hypothetical protein